MLLFHAFFPAGGGYCAGRSHPAFPVSRDTDGFRMFVYRNVTGRDDFTVTLHINKTERMWRWPGMNMYLKQGI